MKKIIIVLSFIKMAMGGVVADSSAGESASGFLTSLPPLTPSLLSPDDKAFGIPDTVTMTWHSQVHTATYTLQVSASPDFSALVINQTSMTDTLFSAATLKYNTTYFWRVNGSNVAGTGTFSEAWSFTTTSPSALNEKNSNIPERYELLPAYPNPFNPTTTIVYHLPENADVSLVIYNIMGQSVRKLASGRRPPGEYMSTWDGRNNHFAPVTGGLYICRFKSGSHVFTQKLLLMR